MAISFKGAHFPPEVILMGVRWYLAYPLSTRHVEELMAERQGVRSITPRLIGVADHKCILIHSGTTNRAKTGPHSVQPAHKQPRGRRFYPRNCSADAWICVAPDALPFLPNLGYFFFTSSSESCSMRSKIDVRCS